MEASYLYDRRNQFRLHYPIKDRPRLAVENADYAVVDISEGGLKVVFGKNARIPEKFRFAGIIEYVDGKKVAVSGKILRTFEHGFSAEFFRKIGMQGIMADQRRLKQKYPMLFDQRAPAAALAASH